MGGCPILNTFEKNYCEGHRHRPHALGDPSEVVSELLFFDNEEMIFVRLDQSQVPKPPQLVVIAL